MTFDDVLAQVAARLNYKNGLTPDAKTRMLGYLANRHRQLVAKVGAKLRDVVGAPVLTTVSGQQLYALPANIKAIKRLYDLVNRRYIYPVNVGIVRLTNPGGQTTNFGLPVRFADVGYIPYQLPMSNTTGSTLLVSSTSATDNALSATVEYVRAGGYTTSASVAIASGVQTQVGSDADIVEITKFYVANTAVGTITLAEGGSNNTISTIGPNQTFARFRGILMDPTPNANLAYTGDFTRTITDPLLNSKDEPLIDEDWQWLLVSGVLMDEHSKNENSAGYLQAQNEWEQGILDLTSDMLNIDGLVIVPNRGRMPKPYPFRIPVTDSN